MNKIAFNPGELTSSKIDIIIRGESFRDGVESQTECIKSMLELIALPLIKDGKDVSCVLTVYEHKLNYKIVDLLSNSGYFTKIYKYYSNRLVIRSQAQNFLTSLQVSDEGRCALIIRPDLLFKKKIPDENMFKDRFCFQWNYFHDSQTRECADQIHFVGSSIKPKVICVLSKNIDMLGRLSDGTGAHTLHNTYNVLYDDFFIRDKISYLVQYCLSDSDFEGSYCKLRGNPDYSTLNDLFEYRRTLRKLPICTRIFHYLCRKLNL
ncbi:MULTISPECIES: hypothetical protein [unclassified Vibrio]|uniref:hypothetical protein n=1 Tax=unclassified Vibrio TaxID=2614977 RepID=UPI000CBDD63E|nr:MULTISPECIES: hypothetical protein [unclassified Vibrio]PMK18708.1 hypothetical protein BCU05_17355 [Vibrio sp. 10N.261.54.C3]TKF38449.1 hypothetical protein FCV57_15165 [Vibrio sp. F13]